MGYSGAAWERAMKIQEVILRALSGEIHWFQATEILGVSTLTKASRRPDRPALACNGTGAANVLFHVANDRHRRKRSISSPPTSR